MEIAHNRVIASAFYTKNSHLLHSFHFSGMKNAAINKMCIRDRQFPVVFSNVLPKKIKTIADMRDYRFVLGDLQAALRHKVLDERHDFVAQSFRAFPGNDKVVGISHEVNLVVNSFISAEEQPA